MTADFDGSTYEPLFDGTRLKTLLARVRHLLSANAGRWFTIKGIQSHCGGTPASVSARIRDLRKPKFGQFHIERRRVGDPRDGLWEYRIVGKAGDGCPEVVICPHCGQPIAGD